MSEDRAPRGARLMIDYGDDEVHVAIPLHVGERIAGPFSTDEGPVLIRIRVEKVEQ